MNIATLKQEDIVGLNMFGTYIIFGEINFFILTLIPQIHSLSVKPREEANSETPSHVHRRESQSRPLHSRLLKASIIVILILLNITSTSRTSHG